MSCGSPASPPPLAERLALSGVTRRALGGVVASFAAKKRPRRASDPEPRRSVGVGKPKPAKKAAAEDADLDAQRLFMFLTAATDTEAAKLLGKAVPGNAAWLKSLARAANLHSSWQHVGRGQLPGLRKQLAEKRREVQLFKESVVGTAAKAAKDCGRQWQREGAREPTTPPIAPCVHFIPSGSGSFVRTARGRTVVLTCAHCVDHDDDYSDGESGSHEDDMDGGEGGTGGAPRRKSRRCRNIGAQSEATPQPVVPIKSDAKGLSRVGRHLVMVWPDGEIGLCRTIAANDRSDVAILELLHRESMPGPATAAGSGDIASGVAVARVSSSPPEKSTPIICIHNPYDWDLELKSGAKPRRSGYTPFTTSSGRIEGYRTGDRTDASDLGAVIHSCWTYWGTSGAPLFNMKGEIVAMHNSWNKYNANRHGVPFESIAGFLSAH